MVTELDAAVKVEKHDVAGTDKRLVRADGDDIAVLSDLLGVGGEDDAGRCLLNTRAQVDDNAVSRRAHPENVRVCERHRSPPFRQDLATRRCGGRYRRWCGGRGCRCGQEHGDGSRGHGQRGWPERKPR